MALVESVPNISNARRADVVETGARAVRSAGARLLDLHRDRDHDRTVYTIAGDPDHVVAALDALADTAITALDLRRQTGVHPRVGVVDVVPFVPIGDVPLETCVALARHFGAGLAARHDLPVFLYDAAATAAPRRRLEAIRRGGLEALAARMQDDPAWRPDFGPAVPHPSAGVTIVGARIPLIAWNIQLATDNVAVATAIARAIRESSGGLPGVKALGVPLAARGLAQVTMNLTDYRVTSMRTVFEAVVAAAAMHDVSVVDTEIVGLVPRAALSDEDARVLRVRDYDGRHILEHRLAAT